MEKLARDKHSSLLRKSLNYGQKSFMTLASGPGAIIEFTEEVKLPGHAGSSLLQPGSKNIKSFVIVNYDRKLCFCLEHNLG